MDILKVLEQAGSTSLFDLYRLSMFLTKAFTDPKRLNEIRSQLRLNQTVRYFDPSTHQEKTAKLIWLKPNYALVLDQEDERQWKTPYYMINTQDIKTEPQINQSKVNRMTLKVGEQVVFMNRENIPMYGCVVRLNQKTATIRLSTGNEWRVSYNLLCYVLEGQVIQGNIIEHSI